MLEHAGDDRDALDDSGGLPAARSRYTTDSETSGGGSGGFPRDVTEQKKNEDFFFFASSCHKKPAERRANGGRLGLGGASWMLHIYSRVSGNKLVLTSVAIPAVAIRRQCG